MAQRADMAASSLRLKILVGTMTNTAEYVAQAIQMDCADLMADIEVQLMDGLGIEVFDEAQAAQTLYLVCCSTYGAGDVPDNAQALYQSLETRPRYLGHVRYGVIALGDRGHAPTYCFGALKFDARLRDLGAQRVGDIWCHDASAGTVAETEGATWCRRWISLALSPGTGPRG